VPRAPLSDEERTEVLVLGTEHLSVLGDSFSPGLLSGVLEALERFRPDAIAIEQMPAEEIARIAAEAAAAPGGVAARILEAFCPDAAYLGSKAREDLNIRYPRANSAADSLLAVARPDGCAASTLSLIAYLLAAYDLPSAVLQWSHFAETASPGAETLPEGAALSGETITVLKSLASSPNEVYSIGVELAVRLGHRRLYSIDDHTDDMLGLKWGIWEIIGKELPGNPEYAEFLASPYIAEAQNRLPDAASTGDLLELFKILNTDEYGRADVESQWHLFYRTRLPSGSDRTRTALWETRNLIITARLMEVCAAYPGGRILVVIGAAHKPFLDQYLGATMDVRSISFEELLKDINREG
jgi:hypothetical protein